MGWQREMEPARGHGWAGMLYDRSLEGEICLEGGDDIPFIARRSTDHFFNSLLVAAVVGLFWGSCVR